MQDFENSSVRSCSTSALATKVSVSVSKLIQSLEPSANKSLVVKPAVMSDLKASLEPFGKSRASQKGWVTRTLTTLEGLNTGGTLTLFLFKKQENSINSYISKLNEIEDKILKFMISTIFQLTIQTGPKMVMPLINL